MLIREVKKSDIGGLQELYLHLHERISEIIRMNSIKKSDTKLLELFRMQTGLVNLISGWRKDWCKEINKKLHGYK